MKNACIFAVTVGRTDIKIRLETKDGKHEIFDIDESSTRNFHQMLRNALAHDRSRLQYVPVMTESRGDQEVSPRKFKTVEVNEAGVFSSNDGVILESNPQKLELIFPKLEAPVSVLVSEQGSQSDFVKGAIVYYTDRSDQANSNNKEPFAVGEIVQDWLASQLKFTSAPSLGACWENGSVYRVNYLKGKPKIEGAGRDYPVYRSICKEIEQPLRLARDKFPDAHLSLSTLGGMQAVNQVLYAMARMFFNDVRHITATERRFAVHEIAFADQALSAEESYQLRAHAIALIKRGHFGPAFELINDRMLSAGSEQAPWQSTLKQVHYLLQGQWRPDAYPHAGQLHQRLLSKELHYCPRTLVQLLRIDAALYVSHLPLAMQLSLTLPHVVMLDGFSRFLLCQSRQQQLELKDKRFWAMEGEADCIDVHKQRFTLHPIRNDALRKRVYDQLTKKNSCAPKRANINESSSMPFWELKDLWNMGSPQCEFSSVGEQWLTFWDQIELRSIAKDVSFEPLDYPLRALCQPKYFALHEHSFNQTAQVWADVRQIPSSGELAEPWLKAGLWEKGNEKRWRVSRELLLPILKALGYNQIPPSIDELILLSCAPMYDSVMN